MALIIDEQLLELPFSKLKDPHFQGVVQSLSCNHSREWDWIHGKNVAGCHPTPRHPRSRNFLRGFILRKLRLGSNERGDQKPQEKHNLATFLELPLEIILEIFKHAHPLDLYHLSMTSQWLRQSLISRASISVWASSFENHEGDIPGPPPRLKSRPAAWADFLFGPTICEMCGSNWAELDFMFVQKLCYACRKVKLITDSEVHELCANWDEGSISYYDPDSDGSSIASLDSKVFGLCRESLWLSVNLVRSQSDAATHKYLRNEVDEALRLSSGTANFPIESSVTAKRDEVDASGEHARRCLSWISDIFWKMREVESFWSPKYFEKLGYTEADFTTRTLELFEYPQESVLRGLSKGRDARYYFATMESRVCQQRAKRIRNGFRDALWTVYNRRKASYPAYEWKYLPHHSLLFHSTPLFSSLFGGLPSGNPRFPLPEFPESLVADSIPTALSTWRAQFRQDMLELIPDSIKTEFEVQHKAPFREEMINLAIMVFGCRCTSVPNVAPCCGLDEILSHQCICWSSSDIHWSHRGSLAVQAILKCLDLEPWTTTAQDLDQLNARFFCGIEPPYVSESRGGYYFRPALTWRECVGHFLIGAPNCRAPQFPRWFLLAPDATKLVHSREREWPRFKDRIWACTHCGEHLYCQQNYFDVEKHLKERHGITLPPPLRQPLPYPCGDDIIHFPRVSYPDGPRNPVFYPVDPWFVKCILCLQNANGTADGLITTILKDKLQEHFSEVHDMSAKPVEGRDWEGVPAYHE